MRATARPRAGGSPVIITVVPVEVGHDGLPAHFIEGDLLRAVARRRGDGNSRSDHVRVHDGPLEGLHAAHRTAGYGEQAFDAEVLDQHVL